MHPELRGWTDIERTNQANVRLGTTLCVVAGAANAGGFLAVGQYTSHMTGVVSSVVDAMVLGHWSAVVAGIAALLAFVLGAMSTAWLVNWGLRQHLQSAFGLPLLVEALALLLFGLCGTLLDHWGGWSLSITVLLLCYTMGLQNAVITKISKAEIRTTHLTGLVTDLGIELGKLLYINRHPNTLPVLANRNKLILQSRLVGSFVVGAVLGAWGFKCWGYITTLPLAMLLLVLIWRPIATDLQRRLTRS